MRLLGLTNFASKPLPLARLHSQPLQFWLKENYKTPADLFKGLKSDPEAFQALYWWQTFKPQLESIFKPLIEEVITTDAPKEGYGGQINNLSFRGKWFVKKGRNTNINILELETVWMTCQKFGESIKGKTASFQINTTTVAYLLTERGTHCKTVNGLARKILLKYNKNGVMICPKYLRGVAILQTDVLSRGKGAQE